MTCLAMFFTIQRNWIVLGSCPFFKYLLIQFHDFWSQIGVVIGVVRSQIGDFGHAEAENGEKKRVVLQRNIFCSNFKVEWENCVWTNIRSLASGFRSHAAISLWFLLFFRFFDLFFCFVLNWLPGVDFFNDFSDFYCSAVKICVCDVISAFRSFAWLTSLKKWLPNLLKELLWTFTN